MSRPAAIAPSHWPARATGAAAVIGTVALVTAAIYGVREIAPVASTGVLYLLAVLLISTRWGLAHGLATAVLGALAFNFFHLPPTGRLTIASDENWVALAVFLVVAAVSSRLAERARRRAEEAERRTREADALASLAEVLMASANTEQARAALAARLSTAFTLPSAAVELRTAPGDTRTLDLPLATEAERVGTLLIPRDTPPATIEGLRRVTPSLAAMLAVSRRRDTLESEVVETQALRRSDVVKTALLRAVSHDLRSPLTAIVAAADGLKAGGPGAPELADVVAEESHRLARMVDDLLDLTRLEAGSATPRPRWCAIDEVIEHAITALPADARLELQVEPDLPLVQADPAQLERALSNLLVNAAEHGGSDQPIAVRARHVSHRIRVRVSDHGPGIPREALERVFEPFQREGQSQGAGLGLAIARGFTEANGGRLWAESLPGQGATFTVEIPVRVRPRQGAAAAAEEGA